MVNALLASTEYIYNQPWPCMAHLAQARFHRRWRMIVKIKQESVALLRLVLHEELACMNHHACHLSMHTGHVCYGQDTSMLFPGILPWQ